MAEDAFLRAETDIDRANAEFWNELCGTGLARHLGITDHSPDSLRRFDDFYLGLYPYLLGHVPVGTMRDKRVVEIGLGYGTLGQKIAESGADYMGLDIAEGPVKMMNARLRVQGLAGRAEQGNMLACTLPNASVDCVVSIGCFHHTGNAQRCIDESWRVLRPGGYAYIMVYNQYSYRQWARWPAATWRAFLHDYGLRANRHRATDDQRKAYDADAVGRSAPETEFFSIRRLRGMFSQFHRVRFCKENCDPLVGRGKIVAERETLLPYLGRRWGLDIYVEAMK